MPRASKTNYDFGGWATKNDVLCSDKRIIRKGAFKHCDGRIVPLVYNHDHGSISSILGNAYLEDRPEGVYAYCLFNNSKAGQDAKETVCHGDVCSLSVWANELMETENANSTDVLHGDIKELSLVLAGANPGARIESVICHGEIMDGESEGLIIMMEPLDIPDIETPIIAHSDDPKPKNDDNNNDDPDKVEDVTIGEALDSMTPTQKAAVSIIAEEIINQYKNGRDEEGKDMHHNIFDNETGTAVISHSALNQVINDAKNTYGTLKKSIAYHMESGVLAHADPSIKDGMTTSSGKQTYAFNDPEMLFPEFRSVNGNAPEFISRDQGWVTKFMSAVHRTPFSRIKTTYADITEEAARARGYFKGKQKKEEVFSILKRVTAPQTIYKLQKLDRDDILDIVDYDVAVWLLGEMRLMLNEEVARAALIGDGRLADSPDKIKEENVRPIAKDVFLYNTTVVITLDSGQSLADVAEKLEDEIVRSRKHYKGSGNPTLWTIEDVATELLLRKNKNGDRVYKTETELATGLRVKEIVTVEPMDGTKVTYESEELELLGTMVNPIDYNIGADKGGEITNMEDFDIDFNQQKYLVETRISGALIRPKAAVTFLLKRTGTADPSRVQSSAQPYTNRSND